jgi:hypothetical protein
MDEKNKKQIFWGIIINTTIIILALSMSLILHPRFLPIIWVLGLITTLILLIYFFKTVGIIISIVIIIGILFLPAIIRRPHKSTRLIACQSNLKNIIALIKMYAVDHNGKYPSHLGLLYSIYADDIALFLTARLL